MMVPSCDQIKGLSKASSQAEFQAQPAPGLEGLGLTQVCEVNRYVWMVTCCMIVWLHLETICVSSCFSSLH